jgi:hypothetical protein
METEEETMANWRLNLLISFPDSDSEEEETEGMSVTSLQVNENVDKKMKISLPLENERNMVDAEIQTEEVVPMSHTSRSTQTEEQGQEVPPMLRKNCSSSVPPLASIVAVSIEHDHSKKDNERRHGHRNGYDPEDFNRDLFEQYGDEKTIEKEIHKRRLSLEFTAERAARTRQAQWVHDRISLEQAIDELFSDHLLLHEKAHALRLHFEREKNLWSRAIQQKLENWKDREVMIKGHPQHSFGSSYSNSYSSHGENENEDNMLQLRSMSPPMSPTLANWNQKDPVQPDDEFEYFQAPPSQSREVDLSEDNLSKDTKMPLPLSRPYRFPSRLSFSGT